MRPRRRRRALAGLVLVAAAATVLPPAPARAADLIPPGIAPKVSGGAGQTVSRGPSALYYNPANLIFSKFLEPYLDVSFAKVTYTYQHTDVDKYDPVVVDVVAPPVTAGLGFRPVPMVALGFAFLPTASGQVQQVPNVPVFTGDGLGYSRMNILTKQSGSKIALGAAARFGFPLAVGAGLVRTSARTQILLTPVDEEGVEADEALIDALYGGAANQFLVGVRTEIVDRAIVVALSYKTASQLVYQGDVLVNTGPEADFEPYEGVDYLPGSLGFGAETRFGPVGVFVDYVREFWSKGRVIARRGFGGEYDELDYYDTNNIAVGGKFWLAGKHMMEGAFGSYGAAIGDGSEVSSPEDGSTLTQEDGGGDLTMAGMQFGNLDGIPRKVFSGGYRYKLTGMGYLTMGAHYQTGTRVVPEGFAQEGTYSLRVIMGSAGVALGF